MLYNILNRPISAVSILCSSAFLTVQHSAAYRSTYTMIILCVGRLIFVWIVPCLFFQILFSLVNTGDAFLIRSF